MSTNCIIIFREDSSRRVIYRHWDGYPEAVLETLENFFKWNTRNDLDYMAANYILFEKLSGIDPDTKVKDILDPDKKKFGIFTGYGITNGHLDDYSYQFKYVIDKNSDGTYLVTINSEKEVILGIPKR